MFKKTSSIVFIYALSFTLFVIILNGMASCSSGYGGRDDRRAYPGAAREEAAPTFRSGVSDAEPASASSRDRQRGEAVSGAELGTEPVNPERMVVYSANLGLQVPDIRRSQERVQNIVDEYEGFVEQVSVQERRGNIRIRVPVASFYDVLTDLSALGAVVRRQISADDITREFHDLDMRLNQAKTLRNRLYELLRANPDTEARIRILRELTRLNEDIERMERLKEGMAERASYSTIHLALSVVQQSEGLPDASLPWVSALRPDRATVEPNDYMNFERPQGFFNNTEEFLRGDSEHRFISPERVVIRTGIVDNNPQAPAEFWKRLIERQMQKRNYEILKSETIRATAAISSDIVYMEMAIPGSTAQRFYGLALVVDRNDVFVMEVYFPDGGTYEENQAAIYEAVASVQIERPLLQRLFSLIF